MRALAIPSLVLLLLAAGTSAATAAAGLTVFGDSYSVPVHGGAPTWATQLRGEHAVGRVHDFAKSGATAAAIRTNTFATQIRRWRAAGRPLGDTVVYLGFNDVGGNLDKARAGYRQGVDELVAAGAARGGNRLILVLPHDVGSAPAYNRDRARRTAYRRQTRELDGFIRSVASRAHATIADVFSAIDEVLDHPRTHGFTNVTTADHAHSRTTALYEDAFHFGLRGQEIIARVIRPRLGRAEALVARR